jgi:hypothetical protein
LCINSQEHRHADSSRQETAQGAGTDEVLDTTAVVLSTPLVRLPAGTVIKATWRVRITHRNGQALTPALLYDVVGDPATTGTAVIAELATTTR